MSLVKLGLHSLDDHHRVIDDGADDKHYCKEGQHVERKANRIDERECACQRHYNRQGRNESRFEAVQEQVDDQHHQQQRYHQRFHHLVDGGIQKILRTRNVCQHDAVGQVAANFFHGAVNLGYDLVGVRAGSLRNHGVCARMTACLAQHGVVHRPEFNGRHIFQPQHGAVGQCPYDYILIIRLVLIPSPVFEHILERVERLSSKRASGRLKVLLGKDLVDVGRNESILRHPRRIEPYAHGILGTENIHLANSGNS